MSRSPAKKVITLRSKFAQGFRGKARLVAGILLILSADAFLETASAQEWIDTKTGKFVASFPVVTDPNGEPGRKTDWVRPDAVDPNRAFDPRTGRNFFYDTADCHWKDAKTGKVVASLPVVTDPNGEPGRKTDWARQDLVDPNRAFDPRTGRNFVRVSCRQPVATTPSAPPSTGVDTMGGPLGRDGQSPPPPTPPPVSTPTHRQTSCGPCQKTADRLNSASDQLAQDLADPNASPETIADDRSMVKDYAQMLDDCEKHCKDTSGADSIFDHVTIGVGVGVGGSHGDNQNHGHNSHGSDNPPTNAQPPQY